MTTAVLMQQTLPGSHGEHDLQERYGTRSRAEAFYKHQMLRYLNPRMRVFLATADSHGECDVSFRAGEAGFVHVLNERMLVYPEYRGNGVLASLGNIAENPHAGLLFIDFFRDKIGLHVNGAVWDEFIGLTAGRPCDMAGMTAARLRRERHLRWPCPSTDHPGTERLYRDGTFPTPSGRARFHARPHQPPRETPDHEFPLVLTTGRLYAHWHTLTRTGKSPKLVRSEPSAFVEVHPDDAAAVGLITGLVGAAGARGIRAARCPRQPEAVDPELRRRLPGVRPGRSVGRGRPVLRQQDVGGHGPRERWGRAGPADARTRRNAEGRRGPLWS